MSSYRYRMAAGDQKAQTVEGLIATESDATPVLGLEGAATLNGQRTTSVLRAYDQRQHVSTPVQLVITGPYTGRDGNEFYRVSPRCEQSPFAVPTTFRDRYQTIMRGGAPCRDKRRPVSAAASKNGIKASEQIIAPTT